MADIPSNLKFLESHEWARVEEDGTVTVGISDHAQELLQVLYLVVDARGLGRVGSEHLVALTHGGSDIDQQKQRGILRVGIAFLQHGYADRK